MRGQATEEFMVVLSALLLLFYIFYTLYIGQISTSHSAMDRLKAASIAGGIRSAINYVYLAGDGAVYNATIAFGNRPMDVLVSGGTVSVMSDVTSYSLPLLTDNMNATSISQGGIGIRNNGGAIEIYQ